MSGTSSALKICNSSWTRRISQRIERIAQQEESVNVMATLANQRRKTIITVDANVKFMLPIPIKTQKIRNGGMSQTW